MKHKIAQQVLGAGLVFALLFTACSKKDNSNNNGYPGGNNSGGNPTPNAVSIANFSFGPSSLSVAKGTTVTWTNNDDAPHTVTADDNSFTSGTLNKGGTYSHQFTSSGTVNYHCNIHPMMTASVTVQQ
jgi:plastocyanin